MSQQLIHAILCHDILEERSGTQTYLRGITQGFIPELPSVMPPLFVSTSWIIDDSPAKLKMTIKLEVESPSKNKEETLKLNIDVDLSSTKTSSGKRIHHLNIQMPGFTVQEYGQHDILVHVKFNENKFKKYACIPLLIGPKDAQ